MNLLSFFEVILRYFTFKSVPKHLFIDAMRINVESILVTRIKTNYIRYVMGPNLKIPISKSSFPLRPISVLTQGIAREVLRTWIITVFVETVTISESQQQQGVLNICELTWKINITAVSCKLVFDFESHSYQDIHLNLLNVQ